MTTTAGPLLVFDGDCGFCTTSIGWLEARFPGSFTAVPYQWTELEPLGLTPEECDAAVRWVGDPARPAGTSSSGARAVGALLRQGGRARGGAAGAVARGLGVLAAVPPTSWAAAGVYTLVARNRHRLPGGTPACRMP